MTTVDDDGTVYVSLVNKHLEEDLEVTLDFLGTSFPTGEATLQTIYAEDIRACNAYGKEPQVTVTDGGTLPAGQRMTLILKKHSVNLLRINRV